jgi:hypothetical protein
LGRARCASVGRVEGIAGGLKFLTEVGLLD